MKNLKELSSAEQVNVNGGNGVHSGGYALAQDMDQSGAFTVGVIYGTVKGLARRWFG
jgi:hypothetical protein